jgi:PAS domain S-box-containing protein
MDSLACLRVLLVDDEPDQIEMVKFGLWNNNRGIESVTATSVSQALELLRSGGFDCIVSDYLMPGMNGLEFCARLRGEGVDTPFILFTGQGSEEIAEKAFSVGVDDYLRKENTLAVYTVLAKNIRGLVDRYRIEKALRASEERYRHLVEYAPTGIYEVSFSPPRFTSVNDAMCRILGYSEEELLQLSPMDILTPESATQFGERIRQAQTGADLQQSVEYIVRRKDGSLIWSQLNIRFKRVDGKIVGASVVANDVTERRKAEQELARLATFPQLNPSPIIEIDTTGKIHYMNPSAVDVLPEVQQVGVSGILGEEWAEIVKDGVGGNKSLQRDVEIGTKWFTLHRYSVPGSDRVRIYALDITQRKMDELEKQESAVLRSSREGSAFLACRQHARRGLVR